MNKTWLKNKLNIVKKVFPSTIPVMTGYIFLGTTYGILATTSGLPLWVPMITCFLIFAGSAEFATASLLLGVFDPLQAVMIGLTLGARHIFYGISMLDKYKNCGLQKPYLIYGLSDETFSLNCIAQVDKDNATSIYVTTTRLDHIYWIIGCYLGAVLGSFITFNTKGLDFVMTAMFVVIYVDNFMKEKNHTASILGLLISLIFLITVGSQYFIIPSLCVIVLVLLCIRKPLEKVLDKRVAGGKENV